MSNENDINHNKSNKTTHTHKKKLLWYYRFIHKYHRDANLVKGISFLFKGKKKNAEI